MTEWMNEPARRVVKCAKCKKIFVRTPEWAWWYRDSIVCSYHCMRTMEREDPHSRINMEARNVTPKTSGLARNMRRITEEEANGIMQDYRAGLNFTLIAEKYDRSPSTISALVRQGGYKPPAQKATLHKPLDDDGRKEIRRLYKRGLNAWDISKQLDLNPTTVYRVINRIKAEDEAKRAKLMEVG